MMPVEIDLEEEPSSHTTKRIKPSHEEENIPMVLLAKGADIAANAMEVEFRIG